MRRTAYTVTLHTNPPATVTAYAWNSGIRAAEGLVRELARREGCLYYGDPATVTAPDGTPARPAAEHATYRRTWRNPGGTAVAVSVTRTP